MLHTKQRFFMSTLNESYLRRVNLNLLVVFMVLMREGSVTRAAERLYVTQAAVSAALARLREVLGDPLFVRMPSGMEPTPQARRIAERLAGPLQAIQEALSENVVFDPDQDRRTFVLGLSDDLEVTLAPRLLEHLQTHHPLIRLNTVQLSRTSVVDMLEQDVIDVALSPPPYERAESLGAQVCVQADYVCMYDPGRVPLDGDISLAEFVALPHIVVSSLRQPHGVVDTGLMPYDMQRRVLTSTSHYAGLISLLKNVAAISTVPLHVARSFQALAGLRFCALPIALPKYSVSLYWHGKNNGADDNLWLRALILEQLAGLEPAE